MSRKKGLIIDPRDICDATPDTISADADAIKLLLANQTRNTFVNEISTLQDNP